MRDSSRSNLRGLLRIAGAATAVGFGSVTGSLYSLRQGPAGMTFHFSAGTLVAFVAGAACGWFYWRMVERVVVRRPSDTPMSPRSTARLIVLNIAAWLIGLAAFLYPMRFVHPERMREVLEGMGAAFLVLTLVGLLLWQVKKFLDRDSERNE